MRVNLSVGLVAMVNSTYVQENSHQKMDPECERHGSNGTVSSKVCNMYDVCFMCVCFKRSLK